MCPRDAAEELVVLRDGRAWNRGAGGGGVSEDARVDLKGTVTLEHSEKGALLSWGSHFLLVLAWTFPLGHDFFKHEPSPLWKNRTIWKGKLPLRTAILGLKR